MFAAHTSNLAAGDYDVVWVATTTPTHRDAVLLVGSWDDKVFFWNFHLALSVLGFTNVDVELLQKVVEWSDQVFTKVEVVVVHSCWQKQTAGTSTPVVQIL